MEKALRIVGSFKALGQPRRLHIFLRLATGPQELSAGRLRELVGVPWATLSAHLEVLFQAGLVSRRKHRRFVYYSVNPETVAELRRVLAAGEPQSLLRFPIE